MDEQLSQGIELFNDGEFFRCHEVLEEAWGLERRPCRRLLQALIHLAVGYYHAKRGNTVGAVRQLRKGIEKLAAYYAFVRGHGYGATISGGTRGHAVYRSGNALIRVSADS